MSESEMAAIAAVESVRRRRGSSFFYTLPVALLAIVAIGFGPTFYFAPLFDAPPLSLVLLLHGVMLTTWFLLLVLQAALAIRGRLLDHRKWGRVALAVAIGVVLSAVIAVLQQVPRIFAMEADIEASLDRASPLFWSGVAMLTAFTTFVTSGIVYVRRTEAHRRLMLLASISLMPPAAARIFGAGTPGTAATVLLLILALFAYDMWRDGRLHPATWLGGLGLIAVAGALIGGVGGSTLGRAVVLSLSAI